MPKLLLIGLLMAVILPLTRIEAQALELKDITNLFKKETNSQNKNEVLEQTKIGQEKFHEPLVSGEKINAVAYLVLPFSKEDVLEKNIKISEGWLYSFDEYHLHNMEVHAGVDFAAPYGTNVYAPVDGYAMSSYHTLPALNKNGDQIVYRDKELKIGLGLFIRIYNPDTGRFLDLAHLSEIEETIPFSEPIHDSDGKWSPTNEKLPIADIPTNPFWAKIKRGGLVGKIGTSGLGLGYDDFPQTPERKITFDPKKNVSWDEPHLHFEEFSLIQNPIEGETIGQKVAPRDIYGIYSFSRDYPALNAPLSSNLKPLILTDNKNSPLFAK